MVAGKSPSHWQNASGDEEQVVTKIVHFDEAAWVAAQAREPPAQSRRRSGTASLEQ